MRIILSKNEIHDDRITISGENARYLTSVLRCRVGDEVQIFDGEGGLYKAEIVEVDNKQIFADIIERSLINTESPLNLVLIQGILKGEKMDWVIQKTTELGVKEIIPVITERSQVRYTRKVERWKKIAEEASRQSGRSIIPVVHEPVNFCDIFSQSLSGFIFWEDGGVRMQDTRYKIQDKETHHASPFFVVIGPEGGLTSREVYFACSRGLIAVSLGKRILRAETAAVSAVTLAQFLLGDIN